MSAAAVPFNPGPSLAEALALQRRGQLREAERIYSRVLKAVPNNFDALNLLGGIRLQQGRAGEAERLLRAAVKANPSIAGAWCNLGHALQLLKRAPEALDCLDKARSLAPADVAVLVQHAHALLDLGRTDEALIEFQDTVARAPGHVDAHIAIGIAQARLGRPDEALAAFDAALRIAPGHASAHYNRGVALLALRRYDEAIVANERALVAAPEHASAWLNRGKGLAQLSRCDEALASYDKALALRKDNADAHFNAALALLTRGDYRRGFAAYEWRWRRTGMPPQKSRGRPLWLGEYPLGGKTILLHAEQGLGDTIQFARYLPQLAKGGAKIVLEVQSELKTMMRSLASAQSIVSPGDAVPPYDVHCPLGSLPLALRTELASVPAPIPYLSAEAERIAKWSARLDALPEPRIAIVWGGNPDHDNDANRSIPFSALAPLFACQASFVGLARESRGEEEAAALAAQPRLTNVGGELQDFSDTAAVLALCDLVIAVDTAAAHLAGAMGRPLWMLLPFAPDWRWTLTGETTPWYPGARLFRQATPGDWRAVLERAAAALAHLVGEKAAGR